MPVSKNFSNSLRAVSIPSIGLSTLHKTYVGFSENEEDLINCPLSQTLNFFNSVSELRKASEIEILMKYKNVLSENTEIAIRLLLWLRDARGGAGERNAFRIILSALSNAPFLENIINKIPEIGRFDDLLIEWKSERALRLALSRFVKGFENPNEIGLAAKWSPRKGIWAYRLRKELGKTASDYRKFIVSNSSTVEQLMCSNKWDDIEYSHVPSIAHSIYRKAFVKHSEDNYLSYLEDVSSGISKINSKIEPHSLASELLSSEVSETVKTGINLQFSSSEYIFGDLKILPIVDVSPSMNSSLTKTLTCKSIAMSLGLNIALKQEGPFNGLVMTFSEVPKIIDYTGKTFSDAIYDLKKQDWGLYTNLVSSFELLFSKAKEIQAKPEDLPDAVVIFSDMEMNDRSVKDFSDQSNAIKSIAKKYGYKNNIPKIVFWNLNFYSKSKSPTIASYDSKDVITVGGFSSNVGKTIFEIIKEDKEITPVSSMLRILMSERYSF